VLLTTGAAGNAPDCLVSVEGADVSAEEVAAHTRVMILFDGHDPGAVETARAQWRTLTKAGAAAKYWSEETGSWKMKAESAAKPGRLAFQHQRTAGNLQPVEALQVAHAQKAVLHLAAVHDRRNAASATLPSATVSSRTGAVCTMPLAVKACPEKISASVPSPARSASSRVSTRSVAPVSTTKRTGVPLTSSVR
jgi:hypothetical protein